MTGAPPRLLLVEDSAAYAHLATYLVEDALGAGGAELTTTPTVAGALALLDVGRHDCVLLDLSLPDAHGLGALDSVVAARPDLPVVVLSGREDDGLEATLLAHGATAFVRKGEEPQRLGEALRLALGLPR